MKCHWCKRKLVPIEHHEDDEQNNFNILGCPEQHAEVWYDNGDMVHYMIFQDSDDQASVRYKMFSLNKKTYIYKSMMGKNLKRLDYHNLMTIDHTVNIVKNGDLCFDINRFLKMKAFL